MNAPRPNASRRGEELLVLAADHQADLAATVRDAADQAATQAGRPLRDWAAEMTGAHRDGGLALAVIGSSFSDMAGKLRHAAERLADPACVRINDRSGIFFTARPLHASGGKVAILFPGEGSQYPGMLADLCVRFPAARAAFDRADRAFANHSRGLLPSQIAFGDAGRDRLWDMDSAVELVFTGNAAVHAVLNTFGLTPDVVVGHSTGDYSALFAAGAIRAADDGEVVALMLGLNKVYEELAATTTLPERALLSVGAGDAGAIERVLDAVSGLDVSMDNCPHQRVLCGAPEVLARARERLAVEGAIVEELAFRRGYHTDAYRPALPVLQPFFDTLPLQAPSIELWSCASASRVPDDLEELRTLALEQWATPVRFTETVLRLWEEGVRVFVESGPRSNLTGFVKDILRDRPHLAVSCDGLHRPTMSHLLFALGQLAAHRVPMDLSPLGIAAIARRSRRDGATDKPPRRTGPVLTLPTGWPEIRLAEATALKFNPPAVQVERVHPATVTPQPHAAGTVVEGSRSTAEPPRAAALDPRAALMTAHLAVGRRMVLAHERVLMQFMTGGAGAVRQPPVSLLSGARVHHRGESLTATVDLSIDRYRFLADHTLGGRVSTADPTLTGLPVMPFTMTLEMAAEAALLLVPGQVCVGFDNVVARRWIALESGSRAAFEIVARHDPSDTGDATVVLVEIAPAGGGDVHFSAAVRLASTYPSAPAARAIRTGGHSRWDREQVYRKAMFHGPLFRGIERVTELDERGADAVLEVLPRSGLLGNGEPAFAIDPVLMDQPGQVVGVWTADRLTDAFVIFPTRLARLDSVLGTARARHSRGVPRRHSSGWRNGGRVGSRRGRRRGARSCALHGMGGQAFRRARHVPRLHARPAPRVAVPSVHLG